MKLVLKSEFFIKLLIDIADKQSCQQLKNNKRAI